MSGEPTRSADAVALGTDGTAGPGVFRLLALGCVLVLTASYVSVLRDVTRVVGGTDTLLVLVGGMVLAATIVAWLIGPRTATVLAVVVAGVGFAYYLERSGVGVATVLSASDVFVSLAGDVVTLATGLELLRMVEAGTWTLGFAPGPVFLSWYLAVRGRYGSSALVGGFALFFLVLTGDAGSQVTLIGVLAALGAVAFGDLERRGGSIAQADVVAVAFAVIVVLSLTVTAVPGGTGSASPSIGSAGEGTLEGTIDSAPERSGISGQVDLSPEIRFTVESDRPSYWRTGVYDRYTGDEWVRTGQSHALEDATLERPPGTTETVGQTVTVESRLGTMPVAPHPVDVAGGIEEYTEVSAHGQVRPATTLLEGDTYAVESAVVDDSPARLQAAGTNYPDEIEETYLQTPETLSPEFEQRTGAVTDDAETPYETAVAIEQYLRSSKEYSLDVERPDGDPAEAFLLEMDEGYCVYFATTMTQMLRAEDVPARYVTGYTSGERVDDEYVVRGTDAHAWVEVYFPDHGWVTFEPTPPEPREAEHAERLEDARQDAPDSAETEDDGEADGEDDVTDPESSDEETDPSTDEAESATNDSDAADGTPFDFVEGDGADDDGIASPVPISRELVAIGSILLVGLLAAGRRTGTPGWLRRTVSLYWQRPTADPDRDVERAFDRLEAALSREYRPRRPSEPARSYLSALESSHDLDDRARVVLESYERAVYGGGIGRDEADRAIELVDEIVRDRLPVVGRSRN